MFISRLVAKIHLHDTYGENHWYGIRALFVLLWLFFVDYIYGQRDPLIYFFWMPLLTLMVERCGQTLRERIILYGVTVICSAFTIFMFGMLSLYQYFFSFFVFFYAILMYLFYMNFFKDGMVIASLVLGIGSFSLIFAESDLNFYMALNHFLESMFAGCTVIAALVWFPKKYSWQIWRRAWLKFLLDAKTFMQQPHALIFEFESLAVQQRHSYLIQKKSCAWHSVLRITRWSDEMRMMLLSRVKLQDAASSTGAQFSQQIDHLYQHVLVEKTCTPLTYEHTTPIEDLLYRMILSWNYLCKTH